MAPEASSSLASLQPGAGGLIALLSRLNASLPADVWRSPTPRTLDVPSRRTARLVNASASLVTRRPHTAGSQSSAAVSLLAPGLCCKCEPHGNEDDLIHPFHCCPCEQNTCPCPAFHDNAVVAMNCRKRIKFKNCYALDSVRFCVCPKWQVVATDNFETVSAKGFAMGPDWSGMRNGRQFPVIHEITTYPQCAQRCLDEPDCSNFLSYLDSTCALFASSYLPWHWELEGAAQYHKQRVDVTEFYGKGECRCKGGKMNRYHYKSINTELECAEQCTASLGCLGITSGSRSWSWPEKVPNYDQLTIANYDHGCDIITSHKSIMVLPYPELAVEFLPGDDTDCGYIDGVSSNTARGAASECRTARQTALLG